MSVAWKAGEWKSLEHFKDKAASRGRTVTEILGPMEAVQNALSKWNGVVAGSDWSSKWAWHLQEPLFEVSCGSPKVCLWSRRTE